MRQVPTLDAVPLEPPPPTGFVDAASYLSPAFFEREMRDVFSRVWVLVGDTDELENPGDFLAEFVGYEPVLVLRGTDGELRAFSNVCPHRACTLLEERGNCGDIIECPYHGWSFRLDGSLAGVTARKQLLASPDGLGLQPLRVATFERFVFVNVSGDAPPLDEYLEDVPALLANHHIRPQRRMSACDDVVDVNWKIFIENANDDYHIPFVHDATLRDSHAGMTFREDLGTAWTNILWSPLNERGLSLYTIYEPLEEEARLGSYAIDVFPNLIFLAFPDGGVMTMRWTPLGLTRTRARVQGYSHSEPHSVDDAAYAAVMRAIQDEDYAVVGRVQDGLRSRLYRPGPAHYLEQRVQRFQARLIALLAEHVGSTEPAPARVASAPLPNGVEISDG